MAQNFSPTKPVSAVFKRRRVPDSCVCSGEKSPCQNLETGNCKAEIIPCKRDSSET